MKITATDSAPGSQDHARWTLIRGARQLLTLRGASGPRRGSAMADLSIIPDGAVLIRDGVIEETGTTRRVENLVPSRLAREIDASGKIVMPAFVDADVPLAAPPPDLRSVGDAASSDRLAGEADIRRMSRRRLEHYADAMAADLVRYGVLTVGSHTLSAPDLQNTNKALRLHQSMQSKPLRIRSIFAPPCETGATGTVSGDNGDRRSLVTGTWMPAVFRRKLSSLLEIPVASAHIQGARAMAVAAAAIGYSIRFRVSGPANRDVLELAYSAGAVSLLGPVPVNSAITRALGDVGCVKVILASRILAGNGVSKRSAIDDGIPLALASGYRHDGTVCLNPQFLLYLACQTLGMRLEEAIVCATYNAACSLRFSHVTGSLSPGKSADICIMDVDDYHELVRHAGHHDAYLVIRAGKVVYRRPNLTIE